MAKSLKKGMMTSSDGNIFHVTGPLWGESTGHRWIPLTKASDTGLWCLFDLRLKKRLSKIRDADGLRRNRAHYDVIVMSFHAIASSCEGRFAMKDGIFSSLLDRRNF